MKTATATDTFVLDASAVAKRLGAEPESQALCDWADQALEAGAHFLAPHLVRYEVGQVLARQAKRSPRLTPALRDGLLSGALLAVQFVDGEGISAHAPPLTYYDAAYLALAKATGATLVSYDKALLEAARRAEVPTRSPR